MKLTQETVSHLIQNLEEQIKLNEKTAKESLVKYNDEKGFEYFNGKVDGIRIAIHNIKLFLYEDESYKNIAKAISEIEKINKKPTKRTTTKRTVKRTVRKHY